MAYAVPKLASAFSNAPSKGKKRPREHDKGHLAWLSTLPCVITGRRPVHVAHIRYADRTYGKAATGMGEKPSDKWCVPLLAELHLNGPNAQHNGNERLFWARYGLDPLRIALSLYVNTGDDEQAAVIIAESVALARAARPVLWDASTDPEHRETSE